MSIACHLFSYSNNAHILYSGSSNAFHLFSSYKSRHEFAADGRTVFDNCETYNEDDSEVGQAGHAMKKFLEKRFKELFGEDS